MKHKKRLTKLEKRARSKEQSDLSGWMLIASPGSAPGTFRMTRMDGTVHILSSEQFDEIAEYSYATEGKPVLIVAKWYGPNPLDSEE